MLAPERVAYLGLGPISPFEAAGSRRAASPPSRSPTSAADPAGAARAALAALGGRRARSRCTSTSTWSTSSTRRWPRTRTARPGLPLAAAGAALAALLRDPRVRAVTVTEFNPGHGDDATTGRLADLLAAGFAP